MQQKIRYLVSKPGAAGEGLRWFWQPGKTLRAHFAPVRLYPNGGTPADPPDAVVAEAKARNRALDAWRQGRPAPAVREDGPRTGTVAGLVAAYRAHRRFTRTSAATQETYGAALEQILAWCGDTPVRAVQKAQVRKFHEAYAAAAPAMAGLIVSVGRILWNFAESHLDMDVKNPFARIEVESLPPRAQVWPGAALGHLVAAADASGWPSVGTGLVMLMALGQRPSDIMKMTRTAWRIDSGSFWLVQKKTGKLVAVPPTPALVARLESHPPKGVYMIEREARAFGPGAGPWTTDSFRERFQQVRELAIAGSNRLGVRPWAAVWAEALAAEPDLAFDFLPPAEALSAARETAGAPDLRDLQVRDLRRTAVVTMGRAGATAIEIAAVTGHTIAEVIDILQVYCPRDSLTAAGAIAKVADWEARRRTLKS